MEWSTRASSVRNLEVVNQTLLHVSILLFLSLGATLMVIRLARAQKLTFRYAVGWIALGLFGLISSFTIPLVESVAESLSLTPIAVVAGVAVLILITICVQLSISISGLQRQIRSMTEEVAFLQYELDTHIEQTQDK